MVGAAVLNLADCSANLTTTCDARPREPSRLSTGGYVGIMF